MLYIMQWSFFFESNFKRAKLQHQKKMSTTFHKLYKDFKASLHFFLWKKN